MSVATLLDGTMTVWRRSTSTSVRGIELRDVLAVVARDVACTFQERRGLQAPREGGIRRILDGRVYIADTSVDVTDQDIIEITAGPSFGKAPLLEVDSVYPPRGNHVQITVKEWDGVLS